MAVMFFWRKSLKSGQKLADHSTIILGVTNVFYFKSALQEQRPFHDTLMTNDKFRTNNLYSGVQNDGDQNELVLFLLKQFFKVQNAHFIQAISC